MPARRLGGKTWAPAKTYRPATSPAAGSLDRKERIRPPRSIPTPPLKTAGSGREVSSRVDRAPTLRCRRISRRSGHRHKLSPLMSRTRSAGAKNSLSG
jgi:hypothetical protein